MQRGHAARVMVVTMRHVARTALERIWRQWFRHTVSARATASVAAAAAEAAAAAAAAAAAVASAEATQEIATVESEVRVTSCVTRRDFARCGATHMEGGATPEIERSPTHRFCRSAG